MTYHIENKHYEIAFKKESRQAISFLLNQIGYAPVEGCIITDLHHLKTIELIQADMKKTIAVDFDGVIHAYSKGWHDGTIYDVPQEGAQEALADLQQAGFKIVIYSTRCHDRTVHGVLQPNQVEEMKEWLEDYGIPYDRIHTDPGKPLCVAFIDDNAIAHTDWSSTIDALETKLHHVIRPDSA